MLFAPLTARRILNISTKEINHPQSSLQDPTNRPYPLLAPVDFQQSRFQRGHRDLA